MFEYKENWQFISGIVGIVIVILVYLLLLKCWCCCCKNLDLQEFELEWAIQDQAACVECESQETIITLFSPSKGMIPMDHQTDLLTGPPLDSSTDPLRAQQWTTLQQASQQTLEEPQQV